MEPNTLPLSSAPWKSGGAMHLKPSPRQIALASLMRRSRFSASPTYELGDGLGIPGRDVHYLSAPGLRRGVVHAVVARAVAAYGFQVRQGVYHLRGDLVAAHEHGVDGLGVVQIVDHCCVGAQQRLGVRVELFLEVDYHATHLTSVPPRRRA